MSEVTKPIALDESFNTTGQTPKNIADVIKNGLQEVAQAIDSHQGGGGHVILDQNGNALDQEPNMQFVDAHTSDDSVNAKTIIENIKPVTRAQFEVATEDGFYEITDEDDATMEEASADYVEVTADGTVSYSALFNAMYSQSFDRTKINKYSVLVFEKPNGTKYLARVSTIYSDAIFFSEIAEFAANTLYSKIFKFASSSSFMADRANTTDTVYESQLVPNGTKITLYYGTDSCVTNLINQAKYTYMESGESVESALTYPIRKYSFTGTLSSNGTIAFPNDAPSDLTAVIGAVKSGSGYCEIIPLNQNGKIKGLKVLDTDNTTPITGTFDFTVYYI